MFLEKQKADTDAIYYKESKQLENIEQKLSKDYLRFIMLDALSSNLTAYLGKSIPQFLQADVQ